MTDPASTKHTRPLGIEPDEDMAKMLDRPSQDKGEALAEELEQVALAAADAAIDAIRVGFPGWRPSDAQLGFGRAVGKRAYLAALSTAQASGREQIVAWLRASGHSDPGAFAQRAYATAFADAIERGDYLATPVEPSPVDVERVARIADELATRWGEQWKAKYKGKPRDSYENGRLAGLSDGAAIVAREIRAALQSPPVEQPLQAEAQQPSDGLVEEMERLLSAMRVTGLSLPGELAWLIERDHQKSANRQFDEWCRENADAILAALKTRTSPETVELLKEAREACFRDALSEECPTAREEKFGLVNHIDAHLSNTTGGSDQHG